MKKLAVLGHPINHTLSPLMHNASIQALGLSAEYQYGQLDVSPDTLMECLAKLPSKGYIGVNLTIPLKEIAFQGLEKLDESAKLFGAVNTVQFTKTEMIGYNTDGYGLLKAFNEAFGRGFKDARVFILGCGGAGRTVAFTVARNGAKSIILADIDVLRIEKLTDEIRHIAPHIHIFPSSNPLQQNQLAHTADIIIQASPVGMRKGDPSPLPPDIFHEGQCVFDLVYMYPETALLCAAKAAGARIDNGLNMLLYQGARSFKIWTGIRPDINAMRGVLEREVYS